MKSYSLVMYKSFKYRREKFSRLELELVEVKRYSPPNLILVYTKQETIEGEEKNGQKGAFFFVCGFFLFSENRRLKQKDKERKSSSISNTVNCH